jgi:hypothetical protein
MTGRAPATEAEAIAQGCQRVEGITLDSKKASVLRECSQLNPGDKCAEYPCENGKMLVIYCDGQNGCTRYYECPC